MKVWEIVEIIDGQVICNNELSDKEVERAFSSDLMSDVLTVNAENMMLITGLANIQTIRTAEMADIPVIVLARSKRATREMINLAKENEMVIIETAMSVFRTSGLLYQAGLKPLY